jgi:hypothetical protein
MADLDAVSPRTIRTELVRLGFELVDDVGRAGDTWLKRTDPEAPTVLVPRERDAGISGYRETLHSALERLSWITGETAGEIARRISARGDRLELRILHELTARHSLRAIDAPAVIEGFVNVIKSGARMRFSGPRADHRGTGGGDYNTALESIELLAPAPGSFMLIAVAASETQLTFQPDLTSTYASEALASTIQSLDTLSREERPAQELSEADVRGLVEGGVSLQMLNAVQQLTFSHSSGLRLEFRGCWDAELGVRHLPTECVVLRDHHLSLARELKPLFKAQITDQTADLFGWVEWAHADALQREGRPRGFVIVNGRVEGRVRNVVVDLDEDLFPQARPGASFLRARGRLEFLNNRWHLIDPYDIDVTDA